MAKKVNRAKANTAIQALAYCGNLTQAAEMAGMNRTTLYRLIHTKQEFRDAYLEEVKSARIERRERLARLYEKSLDNLEAMLESENEATRLKAVQIIGEAYKEAESSMMVSVDGSFDLWQEPNYANEAFQMLATYGGELEAQQNATILEYPNE